MPKEFFPQGSYVALITPFTRKGRIDWRRIESWVEQQVAAKTEGIILAATTGEGPSLTEAEKQRITQVCIKTAAGRILVVPSTGYSDTLRTVRATTQAMEMGGDACLIVTPFYNRPSPRGLVLHFREAANVGLPVIVYHNPVRAGIKMTAETIEEISQIPGVVGYKDSTHDLELLKTVRKACPRLSILSGDDDFTLELMRAGGNGVISVIGNLFPQGWGKMVRLALDGKWNEAKILFDRFLPLCKALFQETNPQGVKFAKSWIGGCEPIWRLPLVSPLETTQQKLKNAVLNIILPQYVREESLAI